MAKLDEIYSRELIGDISKGRYNRQKVDGMLRSLYEMGYNEGREWAERNLIEFMLLQMAQELHYEFGFGKKRLNRFYDEMEAALEGYAAGAYNMEDMRQALKDDAKMGESIPLTDKEEKVRKKRAWLMRYGRVCDEVALLEERIAFLNDVICSAKHPRFRPEGGVGKGETTEEKVNRRFLLEDRLEKKKEERDALYEETAEVIGRVDNLSYRRILQMIYLERSSVPAYVARYHYSRTYVYRLLEQAEESIVLK